VPHQVAGEHADRDVRGDAFLRPVVDRAQVQIVDLDDPKVALHGGQILAGEHYPGRVEVVG
jgi:hypothetical protein